MKRVASVFSALILSSAAYAQEADPSLDDLGARPQGPSELDILSEGAVTDFPDIDAVKARKPVSVTLRALNKVTAKYRDIVINIGETGKYGALELTPRYCDKRPPEEFPETTAFVEIVDKSAERRSSFKKAAPKAEHVKADSGVAAAGGERRLPEGVIFSGWMFASSPALNGVEHPVYDVWVIDCKTVSVES